MLIFATVLIAALALAYWLHHLFEGERLFVDLYREWSLSRSDLADLDAKWAGCRKSDVVVSLTTIPSRIGLIEDTIKSLIDQSLPPAQIYLNVPEHCERENCAYEIPPVLAGLNSVTVRRCREWGPATKLIPTLVDADDDQLICVVDDDRIYPYDLIETMHEWAGKMPDAAVTFAGWVVPPDLTDHATTIRTNLFMRPPAPIRAHRLRAPREIDVMLGVMGYMVRPRFFVRDEITDFSTTPRAAYLADDVRTSALCRAPRFAVPGKGLSFLRKRDFGHLKRTALANLNNGPGPAEQRNNTIAIRHYADRWRVGGAGDKTSGP